MSFFSKIKLCFFGLLIAVLSVSHSAAVEEILQYDVKIDLSKNGDMLVRETITVNAEGREIRRGIYRDLPRYFEGEDGTSLRENFDIVSITRNGREEPYHTQYVNGWTRILIGQEDIFIPRGQHIYEITYETDRQIGFLDEGEELYWNAIGDGWIFPIKASQVVVQLQDGGTFNGFEFFTGAYGSTDKNARAVVSADGNIISFELTQSLNPKEGFTIVAKMPRGTIDEPTEAQTRSWFMRDFGHIVVAAVTLGIVGLYYIFAWIFIGRDPKGSRIEQRKTLSLGISPALTHYIDNKGRIDGGWTAISAAILSLAIKRQIRIVQDGDDPVLVKDEVTGLNRLPVGEAAIMKMVMSKPQFALSKANGANVSKLKSSFQKAIEDEHRGVFYEHNSKWIWLGIALSVIGILSTLIFNADGFFSLLISAIISAVFSAFLVPVYFLINRLWRAQSKFWKIFGLVLVGIFGFLLVSFFAAFILALFEETQSWIEFAFIGAVFGLVALNIIFYQLIGRPTALGAEMMNQIKGLRLHLENYHQQRMNLNDVPDMSIKYFEKLLPFAVALGVEKPWSEAFDTWFKSAASTASGLKEYDPYWDRHRWYRNRHSRGGTYSDFGSQMAYSLSSAMPKPKSSSSSSGGFSGGGGGGGGGGGW